MIFREEKTKNYHLGIWKIEESKDELLSFLDNESFLDKDVLNLKSESKLLERLAVRVLLKHLLKKEVEIKYQLSGKPYLKDTNKNISISHTKGYVAILMNNDVYTGIDIQYLTDKVKNIRSRFVSSDEYICEHQQLLHLILHWSAKETMYKVFGQGINLKESFHVIKFEPEPTGQIQVLETFTTDKNLLNITYKVFSDFVLTYTA